MALYVKGAAVGANNDITSMSALAFVSSDVGFTGQLAQGAAVVAGIGMFQGGTETGSTFVSALAQNTTLKPTGNNATASFAHIANVGSIDLSAYSGVGAFTGTAYGVYVGALARADGHTYGSVYAVQNIQPTGTITGGSYTLTDRLGHQTATILATAAVGTPGDGSVANIGTVNYALVNAGINYVASAGPLTVQNIGLTATNPGVDTIMTLAPVVGFTGGGTVAMQLLNAGSPYVNVAYGVFINRPTAAQSNYGMFVNGSLSSPGTPLSGTANESLVYINSVIPPTSSGNGYQKNSLAVYLKQQDTSGLIERDSVAIDNQAWVDDGVTNGFIWVRHTQSNIGFATGTTASPGNSVADEIQVINHGNADSGTMKQTLTQTAAGVAVHQVGFNMVAMGPQKTTAAYTIGASSLGGGQAVGQWHQGLWAQSLSIGSALTDSFLEYDGTFRVGADGRTTIGNNAASATYMLQVYGEAQFGMINTGRSALDIYAIAGATADLAIFDCTPFNANAQVIRIDKSGHVVPVQASPPTAAGGAGAGTSPTIAFASGSSDQSGMIQITIGSSPTAGVQTLVTVTHKNALTNAPHHISLTPANSSAASVVSTVYASAVSASTWTLTTLATLTATGVYWFWYSID